MANTYLSTGEAASEAPDGSREQETADATKEVAYWKREIDDALKREKEWRKSARECVDLYEAVKYKKYQYNILYANTETLAPALYNETPRPVVTRRFKDADPVGAMAAKATQRVLEYEVDPNLQGTAPYDDLMKDAVLGALVPGRGVTRFKMDEIDGADYVCGEQISWDEFIHGYAKTWKKVPWIGLKHLLTRDECIDNFGKEDGGTIPLTQTGSRTGCDGKESTDTDSGDPDLALVYEIWDKRKREMFYVCPEGNGDGDPSGKLLKRTPDPLGLSGFFPVPKPLYLFNKLSTLVPTTLYSQYKAQADELNCITKRLNRVIDAMRVRGVYDSRIAEFEKIFQADENAFVPSESLQGFSDFKQLDNHVWTLPINDLIVVAQQLQVQRQQIKSVIYEITGIADILRGSSVASETATAQEIKAKWGGLRVKRGQKEVVRYCRDALRIMGELSMSKLPEKQLAQMTGLPYPTGMQKAEMKAKVDEATAQGIQVPPQIEQAMNAPGWPEVLALLKSDTLRTYRVDVETNSTIDPEATEDREQITEVMQAISGLLTGLAPLIQSGSMPWEAAKAMLLAIVRRFRFGPEIEEYLQQMQPPRPPPDPNAPKPPDPHEAAKLKFEQDKAQQTGVADAAKFRHEQMVEQRRDLSDRAKMAQEERLERLRVASEERVAMRKIDVERQTALDIANIDARTARETAARKADVDSAKHTADGATKVAQESTRAADTHARTAQDVIKVVENVVGSAQKEKDSGKQSETLIRGFTEALRVLGGPKTVEVKVARDGDGKATGATATSAPKAGA